MYFRVKSFDLNCLILAAGRNTRLDTGKPKSLLKVAGESLLSRHLRIFKSYGVENFCVITGYQAESIEKELVELRELHQVNVSTKHNDRYDLENGFSVSKAETWVSEKEIGDFFMTMGDHIFEEGFVESFISKSAALESDLQLAVDVPSEMNKHIDIDDVTKVDVGDSNRIKAIGKTIEKYNHYDTGLFRLKASVFEVLQNCFSENRFTISDMVTDLINSDQARVTPIPGFTWNDVDNPDDLEGTLKLISDDRL